MLIIGLKGKINIYIFLGDVLRSVRVNTENIIIIQLEFNFYSLFTIINLITLIII